jgi:four helix bundle protein
MKVKTYQELIVWQKAMDLVEEVYKASRSFPREEIYGLTSQLRKSRYFNPFECRRGPRQTHNSGFSASFVNCLRIVAGT